jgi:four helix bundle protein
MGSRIEKFEDIIIWQESRKLVLEVYKTFKPCRDFPFRDQIQRAAVSVMNNIAEGYERKGNKEFIKFLYIAKGSAAEVRSMLYLAIELKYVNSNDFNIMYNKTISISRMISSFIKKL